MFFSFVCMCVCVCVLYQLLHLSFLHKIRIWGSTLYTEPVEIPGSTERSDSTY